MWQTVYTTNTKSLHDSYNREIIVYSRSIINACSLLSHEWWVPLIKFMMGPTIHVRGGVRIYGTPGVLNNFLRYWPSWLILWIHTINSLFKCTARVALIFITCIVASASAIALALKILKQSQFLPFKLVLSKSLSLLFSLAFKMHTTWVCQVQLLFINTHSLSH